jgi:threonine dehydrogenase-like Zn-dependent dehydrogenase
VAPFARLGQVGGVSIQVATARPGDVVAVLGLGPVGNLAAQLAASAGHVVVAVDPSAERRELARACGLDCVVANEEAGDVLAELGGARTVLECSGRAAAVVQSLRLCARHGEVMTVGAPDADVPASAIVARVFEGFLNLRSGWEWQVPLYDDGRGRSVAGCTSWVLDRLLDGSVSTAPLVGGIVTPDEIGSAYARLVDAPGRYATFLIDWTR